MKCRRSESPHLDKHPTVAHILVLIVILPHGFDFPVVTVTKEEFDAKTGVVVETPAVDTKVLADLLGLTPEAVGKTYVWFPTGDSENRGRVFSFLDVAKVHTKEFMAELIAGKRGYSIS
ncbi:hypothetical protein C8R45DRAFT_1101196 [Mycena sanguinolenta]|nr:hypothetical protein C8R45DRAFT_1101196 [Mycena sanguinolenta]